MTIPEETLKRIHPTLKQENTTTTSQTTSTTKKSANTAKDANTANVANVAKGPKPKKAKKEDCIYEINSDNFQKVVLESPVPVLLDVYADCEY